MIVITNKIVIRRLHIPV